MYGFVTVMEKGRETDYEFWLENDPKVYVSGEMENLVSVQLDGDELAHVKENFSGIPHSKYKIVQIFRGDIAKFIVENWKI